MKEPTLKVEAVIERRFHVHLEGETDFYTAESMEEAERIKADLVQRTREKLLLENKDNERMEHLLDFIRRNTAKYIEHLTKQLWHDQRDKVTPKEVVEVKKRIRDDLRGIFKGEVCVEWHQSYSSRNEATWYTVRPTTPEEREEMGVGR